MLANRDLNWLGPPFDPTNPASFQAAVARHRNSDAPTKLLIEARAKNLHLLYTPTAWGGEAADPVASGRTIRKLATRDANLMTGLLMNITPILLTGFLGTEKQLSQVVDRVRDGLDIAYALSEPAHGSDLLATKTTATITEQAVTISGTKALVGLGNTANMFVVVAHTGGRGPASYTAFLVAGDSPGISIVSVHETDGFRGTPFTTVRFDETTVDSGAQLGETGTALEAVLKSQTIVRAFSLPGLQACMDADLWVLANFAKHQRQNKPLRENSVFLAHVGAIAAAMLYAEAAMEFALRGLITDPDGAPVSSAMAKIAVSDASHAVHKGIGELLAVRGTLCEDVWGMHSKVAADSRVISTIDGSTVSTIRAIAPLVNSNPDNWVAPPEVDPHRQTVFDPNQVGVMGARRDPAIWNFLQSAAHDDCPGLSDAISEHFSAVTATDEHSRDMKMVKSVAAVRRTAQLSAAAAAVYLDAQAVPGPLAQAFGSDWVRAAISFPDHNRVLAESALLKKHVEWGRTLLSITEAELETWRLS